MIIAALLPKHAIGHRMSFLPIIRAFSAWRKRREKQKAGDALAFVDDQAFGKFITTVEGWFQDSLRKQTAAAKP